MNINNDPNIAIVHDWFIKNSMGGAEKVTKEIYENIKQRFTEPDIFALVENLSQSKRTNLFPDKKINTSFLQKFPFGIKKVQYFLPLIPFAVEQLDLRKYDLILSSSHLAAKGVLTSPDQLHISYVHTPMRYAWDQMNTYLKYSKLSRIGFEIPIRYLLYKLREWDYYSSQRVDHLISNSNFTAKRIKKYWGLDSEVIHPPVDISRFNYKQERENFYLSVNRLVPNKRIDLLIRSFNKLGLPLVIIGDGPERCKLEKMAKSNIKFLKKVSNFEVETYMSKCRSFIYAGLEDFGIAPLEAMASGAPVIAYGKGGILDTVICFNRTNKKKFSNGVLFKEQTSKEIVDVINWFEDKKIWNNFKSEDLNNYAHKFNPKIFKKKLESFINRAWEEFKINL